MEEEIQEDEEEDQEEVLNNTEHLDVVDPEQVKIEEKEQTNKNFNKTKSIIQSLKKSVMASPKKDINSSSSENSEAEDEKESIKEDNKKPKIKDQNLFSKLKARAEEYKKAADYFVNVIIN